MKIARNVPQIMGMDSQVFIHTWIDKVYIIHKGIDGHNIWVISMDWEVMIQNCSQQKVNTNSSIKAEIVDINYYLPYTLCATYFLKNQGCTLNWNILYQENVSVIKIIEIRRSSYWRKSCHIYLMYSFVYDILERENMEVEYCLRNKMTADHYTKSL